MIDLIDELQIQLGRLIAEGSDAHPHVTAFAGRLLGPNRFREIAPAVEPFQPARRDRAQYEGFPYLAALGFGVGASQQCLDEAAGPLLDGLRRLCNRFSSGATALAADDIALLGLSDGMSKCRSISGFTDQELIDWLVQIIDAPKPVKRLYPRLRSLAGDLLDGRGRLRMHTDLDDQDAVAVELALQAAWPMQFVEVAAIGEEKRREMLRRSLHGARPGSGEVDRAALILKALDVIIDASCVSAIPTVSTTARLLASVQHSMKRWKWEERPVRQSVAATRWLIDDEYDVQSLLWAVLYPIFQTDLIDETYLPSWGNVQARADLAIRSLKLIIEVKIARQVRDFKKIEEEVAGDVGLYFKDTALFNRMIVFVYDDCDEHRPERYGSLINALKARDQVEDVVIVRRPGMIPARGNRS